MLIKIDDDCYYEVDSTIISEIFDLDNRLLLAEGKGNVDLIGDLKEKREKFINDIKKNKPFNLNYIYNIYSMNYIQPVRGEREKESYLHICKNKGCNFLWLDIIAVGAQNCPKCKYNQHLEVEGKLTGEENHNTLLK